jgi:hypothetical protein
MDGVLTKADILKKLETVYWRALQGESWGVALRAAELQGKAVGLFEKHLLPKVSIAEMTEEQLTEFMGRLEKRDPTLKDRAGEPVGEEHLPEKQTDKAGNPESPKVSEDMPEGNYEHPVKPVAFVSPAHKGLANGQEPSNSLHFQKQNSPETPVFPHLPPEKQRPPPIMSSVF